MRCVPMSRRISVRPLGIGTPRRLGQGLGLSGATNRNGICVGIKQSGRKIVAMRNGVGVALARRKQAVTQRGLCNKRKP